LPVLIIGRDGEVGETGACSYYELNIADSSSALHKAETLSSLYPERFWSEVSHPFFDKQTLLKRRASGCKVSLRP
jgi:hypothetical protein